MTRTGAGFGWKYFPYYLIGAMAVVVAVNARFITIAVTTFPGEVTAQDFETSNRYDTILGRAAAQRALGYGVTLAATGQGGAQRIALHLTARNGAPVAAAQVSATLRRPLGDGAADLRFHADGAGGYFASPALPAGQWDIDLTIQDGGNTLHTTQRVILP